MDIERLIDEVEADAAGRWRELLDGVDGADREAVAFLLRLITREHALLATAPPGQVERHRQNIRHAVNTLRSIAARKGYEAETHAREFVLAVLGRLVDAAMKAAV